MTSPEVNLSDQDRNESIAQNSDKIHHRNDIERARALGLRVEILGEIAVIRVGAVLDYIDHLDRHT